MRNIWISELEILPPSVSHTRTRTCEFTDQQKLTHSLKWVWFSGFASPVAGCWLLASWVDLNLLIFPLHGFRWKRI